MSKYIRYKGQLYKAVDMPLPMGKVRDDALKALAKGDWDSVRKAGLTSSERREVEMGKLYKKDVERLGLKIGSSASTKQNSSAGKDVTAETVKAVFERALNKIDGKSLRGKGAFIETNPVVKSILESVHNSIMQIRELKGCSISRDRGRTCSSTFEENIPSGSGRATIKSSGSLYWYYTIKTPRGLIKVGVTAMLGGAIYTDYHNRNGGSSTTISFDFKVKSTSVRVSA